jgi:hypothetical protein
MLQFEIAMRASADQNKKITPGHLLENIEFPLFRKNEKDSLVPSPSGEKVDLIEISVKSGSKRKVCRGEPPYSLTSL